MGNAKRFSVPIVLWVIALALLVVGLLAVTVWKPQQEVVADRDSSQPYTMTRAGVLPLYADRVEVRATGEPDQIVWLVVGQPEDVKGWLEEEPYDEVVGLSDISTLKAVTHAPDDYILEEAQSGEDVEQTLEEEGQSGDSEVAVANPLESDMWTSMKYGRGSVSMVLSGPELDMSVIAATDGEGPAPSLELKWETPQDNHLALIAFVAAAAAALLGVILALLLAASRAKKGPKVTVIDADQDGVETTMLEIVSPDGDQDGAVAEVEDVTADEPDEAITAPEATAPEVTGTGATAPGKAGEEVGEEQGGADVVAEVEESPATAETPLVEETAASDDPFEGMSAAELEAARAAEDAEAQRRREEAKLRREKAEQESVMETVTTESGMMNLSALQSGGAFPTRRALREARERGVDALVVGEDQYEVDPNSKEGQDK